MINLFINMFVKLLIGGGKVVDLYVALIINKRRTIEQVPLHLRDEVLADLNALGLDGNGDPLPIEPTA